MTRGLSLLCLLLLAACGGGHPAAPAPSGLTATPGQPAASTSPPPSSRPSQRLEDVLFAVLEPGSDQSANTSIAITGIDGKARAKVSFGAHQRVQIGNAAPILQLEARPAAGGVFYIDGAGVVRRLAVDGSNQVVASFPTAQAQQVAAFAVSPDGKHLMATILTLPPFVPDPSTPFGTFKAGVPVTIAVETADAGGPTQTVATLDLGPAPAALESSRGLTISGWDSQGPVALKSTLRGTQQGINGYRSLAERTHLDSTGSPTGATLGGPGCVSWAETTGGVIGCGVFAGQNISVRRTDGSVLYEFTADAGNFIYPALSPDGSRTAVFQAGNDQGFTSIRSKAGSQKLGSMFLAEGWLDSDTLVGHVSKIGVQNGNLAIVRLSAPDQVQDLGFQGTFAGIVTPP